MRFHPHTAIPTTQPFPHQNKQNMKTLRSLLSDIIEVIDTLESLKAPKVEKMDRNYYVPKPLTPYTAVNQDEALPQQTFGGTGIQLTTLTPDEELPQQSFGGTGVEMITTTAETLANTLGCPIATVEDGNVTHITTPVWEKARQAIAQGDPEENAHNAAMLTSEAENEIAAAAAELSAFPEPAPTPEAEPEKKTRKPRAAKAPKPEPVDIGAVRQEVAEVISVMVTEGKKDVIKSILATYGVDRARELPDTKILAFRDELTQS